MLNFQAEVEILRMWWKNVCTFWERCIQSCGSIFIWLVVM